MFLAGVPPPFMDVKDSAWYPDAVAFVFSKGMMTSSTDTAFTPEPEINRGMIVTMLHRLEGIPASGRSAFTDVLAEGLTSGMT